MGLVDDTLKFSVNYKNALLKFFNLHNNIKIEQRRSA